MQTTFAESISKWRLSFKDDDLEKEFQDERHKLATIALNRLIKIMFVVVICLLLLELLYFLLGQEVNRQQTKLRIYYLPGYFLSLFIELGLIKLKIRRTRGFLTIVTTLCIFALSPTHGHGDFHPMYIYIYIL